jgi:hypothetical protein
VTTQLLESESLPLRQESDLLLVRGLVRERATELDLVSEFEVVSRVGEGTRITVTRWT